ncbi:lysophosphatidic acid receptor 5 isoform X1 [Cricetulus griseus]|uniref:lysophosphatidic acid receptor 5 isoform X1 n=1 Tax=Cricetulus griseus TaxID=10029 RepID=UPI0015C33B37|nr:lysophosphatidic acid receptor 5 isoform X1 [Cricetulus griseus]
MFANSSANASATDNSSVSQCRDYQGTHRLHMVVYSLVLATGLPLNALALWVFLRVLRINSVVSVYMCNLAASDLLFTLSLPLRLSYYARHHWPFSGFLCQTSGAVFQMNMLAVYGLLRADLVESSPEARDRVRGVLMVMVLLAGANCVLDPLVYYFSAEGFRNTLRDLGTALHTRPLATNGARGVLTEPPSETTQNTGQDATSQGLLQPANLATPVTQCPQDSAL